MINRLPPQFDIALAPAAAAFVVALVAAWFMAPAALRWLRRHCQEPIRTDSARLNELLAAKQATPTMGGLVFVVAGVVAMLLSGDLAGAATWTALAALVGFAALGAVDDLVKLRTRRKGLSAPRKLAAQFALAAITALALSRSAPPATTITSGLLVVLLWTTLIVGFSNAVNITDGLDGLAGGTSAIALATIVVIATAQANRSVATCAAALLGGLCVFLWFNRHPARMFMGNTGSLALGAMLAVLAIALRVEWLMLLVGGVFVAEAASVVLQVAGFKLTGRRLFRCAPLHHHFQFQGHGEPAIVRRFCLAAAVCAVAGLAVSQARTGTSVRTASPTATLIQLAQEASSASELR